MPKIRPIEAAQHSSVIKVGVEADVYAIVGMVKNLTLQLGFTAFQAGLVSLAVAEIAMNAVRHAHHGVVFIDAADNHKGIEIKVEDRGAGINNLSLAMEDGFSTKNTLGLGLGVASRSVDVFSIKSSACGTSVAMASYLPALLDVKV
jgi:serine/threonine-protein kinase RsbT